LSDRPHARTHVRTFPSLSFHRAEKKAAQHSGRWRISAEPNFCAWTFGLCRNSWDVVLWLLSSTISSRMIAWHVCFVLRIW
jgi:hypothetical protein